MKKIKIVIVLVSVLFGPSFSFGGELESIKFDSPESKDRAIVLQGFFSKSGIASPTDTLFFYGCYSIVTSWEDKYVFTGRTGNKTFEITRFFPIMLRKEETKTLKINLYFEENSLCPLEIFPIHSGCSKNDKVFLKMIKLQGNQLEYQIMLPDCLAGKK